MKTTNRILISVILMTVTALLSGHAVAQVFVQGYYRSDGTYVQPHYRSSPDSSYNNNWSVRGNVNPYTGRPGTLPRTWNDRPPTYNYNYNRPYQKNTFPSIDVWGNEIDLENSDTDWLIYGQ